MLNRVARNQMVRNVCAGLGIVLTAACCFCSCATVPPPEALAAADYGAYPEAYEAIIKNHMEGQLKDPYSAHYEFLKGPRQMWTSSFGSAKYGYGVCVSINAKNSFGAYVGQRLYFFLINNGVVIRTCGGSSDFEAASAEKMCKGEW